MAWESGTHHSTYPYTKVLRLIDLKSVYNYLNTILAASNKVFM